MNRILANQRVEPVEFGDILGIVQASGDSAVVIAFYQRQTSVVRSPMAVDLPVTLQQAPFLIEAERCKVRLDGAQDQHVSTGSFLLGVFLNRG